MATRAVIFDLFKTLGEFEWTITDEDVSSLLRGRGHEVYPQAWRHAFSFVVFVDYPRHGFASHEALFEQVFRRLEVEVDDGTVNELADMFRSSPFRLYPESHEAVKRARDMGLKTAVATSTPKPFFRAGVEPIAEYIDFICTGYEAGYEKSNPRIYKVITDRLQVEPKETVVIGDDPVLDIRNAKQRGMRAIHIPRGGDSSELADDVAVDVLGAVDIVEKWFS
jgi:HAD superfamily hydrolase (TIGR01509 family)